MKRLRVTGFGPIRQADVKFGDLTVLVGPQASGKSLFVQLSFRNTRPNTRNFS
ncbi:MAG TPA: hypothetical protein PK156_28925 [Polyangium sp.]|nr:hypothetical protein [Polyangium sp.]